VTRLDRAQSGVMGNEGEQLRARREALGMDVAPLAKELGVNRQTLTAIENGQGYRQKTLSKILNGLDRLEAEAGITKPATRPMEAGMIEFEVSGDFGVKVVVRGPVSDAQALEASVTRIIHNIRTEKGETDPTEG
jgi:transcriptional regulator with XRE-family HTH domain